MLNVDDSFPALVLSLPGGATVRLPDDFSGSWAYIAVYRGGW